MQLTYLNDIQATWGSKKIQKSGDLEWSEECEIANFLIFLDFDFFSHQCHTP